MRAKYIRVRARCARECEEREKWKWLRWLIGLLWCNFIFRHGRFRFVLIPFCFFTVDVVVGAVAFGFSFSRSRDTHNVWVCGVCLPGWQNSDSIYSRCAAWRKRIFEYCRECVTKMWASSVLAIYVMKKKIECGSRNTHSLTHVNARSGLCLRQTGIEWDSCVRSWPIQKHSHVANLLSDVPGVWRVLCTQFYTIRCGRRRWMACATTLALSHNEKLISSWENEKLSRAPKGTFAVWLVVVVRSRFIGGAHSRCSWLISDERSGSPFNDLMFNDSMFDD